MHIKMLFFLKISKTIEVRGMNHSKNNNKNNN